METPTDASAKPPRDSFSCVFSGVLTYYFTTLIVVLAVLFGVGLAKPDPATLEDPEPVDAFANWDGMWYRGIAEKGYAFTPDSQSDVAFFPAYPLLGRLIRHTTGLSTNQSLVLVAHICLACAFVVMAFYATERLRESTTKVRPWVLLSMGLLPMGFFFRMAYSESLFLLLTLLAFYGLKRKWPLWVVASLAGGITATRPVGVAILVPLVVYVWSTSDRATQFILRSACYIPLACWGLISYIAYQWLAFGEPLAFAKTQAYWRVRHPVSASEHLFALATLEPFWALFVPSSPCFANRDGAGVSILFNIDIANSFFYLATILLIIYGGIKRWLDQYEILLSAGLLAIPYLTRSHEMCMASMGRFAAIAFPAFLVTGHLLSRLPPPAAAIALAISSFFMAAYTTLFATEHRIF